MSAYHNRFHIGRLCETNYDSAATTIAVTEISEVTLQVRRSMMAGMM